MRRVFVLDNQQQPLMPCHPARARKLLKKGKACVYRHQPFTIILKHRSSGNKQLLELKADPGSKTTGLSLVLHGKTKSQVVWCANLNHRGHIITKDMDSRRANRRFRRHRKTRYRQPRFLNRTRKAGWLPPSIQSRVDNIVSWSKKLKAFSPITEFGLEIVKFDTQRMQNPEISGTEYQKGTLQGFEVWEYLLTKFNHSCAYCGTKNTRLEKEHVIPKSKGGTNRVSNLVVSCRPCNEKKDNQPLGVFLKGKPSIIKKIKTQLKTSLKDTASVNATRYAIKRELEQLNLPIHTGTGAQTKFNRTNQGYEKDHWIDASCATTTGENITIPKTMKPLIITAQGRGTRQMCRVNKHGFPRTTAKSQKRVRGFATGDLIKANVTKGTKQGIYTGRVAVRSSGSFNIKTKHDTIQGISYKYCTVKQRNDGYAYTI